MLMGISAFWRILPGAERRVSANASSFAMDLSVHRTNTSFRTERYPPVIIRHRYIPLATGRPDCMHTPARPPPAAPARTQTRESGSRWDQSDASGQGSCPSPPEAFLHLRTDPRTESGQTVYGIFLRRSVPGSVGGDRRNTPYSHCGRSTAPAARNLRSRPLRL